MTMLDRRSTGDPGVDADLDRLLDDLGVVENRAVIREVFVSAVRLAQGGHTRLDLKITSAALEEMRQAFSILQPFRDVPKVTIFGSARTRSDDPAYALARDLARGLATEGWMVVTGAGPGIMAAGTEGAGPGMSLGVNIRLPFEQMANEFVEDQERLVTMKYFFTRKLMLIKESKGFVSLPGGFGTLDETFELLTLQQTGKSDPAPIVLLDKPGGTYWAGWERFVADEVEAGGMISPTDHQLWLNTTSVEAACDEITGFYANYHSQRYVGDRLVIRMQRSLDADTLDRINRTCGDLTTDGRITRSGPLPPERDDHPELARLLLRYAPRHYGRLRPLIDLINSG
jgi:uncharacterized protein (TIGR00730 family)